MVALLIEAAPAGDQPEGRVIRVAVDGAGGELVLGVRRTPVILKTATCWSARVTSTRSPGSRSPRRKNTDGPALSEST